MNHLLCLEWPGPAKNVIFNPIASDQIPDCAKFYILMTMTCNNSPIFLRLLAMVSIYALATSSCSSSSNAEDSLCSVKEFGDSSPGLVPGLPGLATKLKQSGYEVSSWFHHVYTCKELCDKEYNSNESQFLYPVLQNEQDSIAVFRSSTGCALLSWATIDSLAGKLNTDIRIWSFRSWIDAERFIRMELIKDKAGFYFFMSNKVNPKRYLFQHENKVFEFPNRGIKKLDQYRSLILAIKQIIGQKDSSYIKIEYD